MKVLREFDVENQDLKQLFDDPAWNGEAPLWFYILKEAEIVGGGTDNGQGRQLGPVGGRIVAEVLVGLLQKDLNSYLYLQPTWKPTHTHRAGPRPVHHGRSSQVRRRLVLTNREVMNFPSAIATEV